MVTREDFKQITMKWAERIGVEPKEVHFRKMKRKWGSCSTKGRLTFDVTILEEPKEERLEKMLHEILHLKYPNHGKMFKALLNTYLDKAIQEEQS